MKIYIGNDHAAVEMKNAIVDHLEKNNIQVENIGTDSNEAVDYPDYGKKVASLVVNDDSSLGIVICGSGIGISIAANKIDGARAALCYEEETTILARQHNNANILALGARISTVEKAISLVDLFINTKFEGGRHQKRVEKL
ncbi:ribose 5-phosphate isomerase B [Spiroplasma apis]|uniref:Ribose-5-phosphate isomerase B n=1 Tax=Spiroplasma apis B31 TaxID=1276258 RepID=V5RGU8_SPIAP|nr:ribose 5-phosphate isomerase B [Spiroplasma apis]AHB35892.1 ribose-5-phosphate isomerase B [Spiroplasma apis B31]